MNLTYWKGNTSNTAAENRSSQLTDLGVDINKAVDQRKRDRVSCLPSLYTNVRSDVRTHGL